MARQQNPRFALGRLRAALRITGRMFLRTPLRRLDFWRILRGGQISDAGRLPRYLVIFAIAAVGVWTPIAAYLRLTPPSFTSTVSLILPGTGASASVNLADIGQASSSASSAYASSSISPTQTYKRLLAANRVLEAAASGLDLRLATLGEPRISLVDETSLMHFEMSGPSPEAAQARADAVLAAFLRELDLLRQDELKHREHSTTEAIAGYTAEVEALRQEISQLQQKSGLLSHAHYTEMVATRDALLEEIEKTKTALASADRRAVAMQALLATDPDTAALNLRLHADPQFQSLAATLSERSAILATVKGQFGPMHPQVRTALAARDGTEAELMAHAAVISGVAQPFLRSRLDLAPDNQRNEMLAELVAQASDCDALRAELASLNAALARTDAELARLAPMADRLDDLSRDYKVAEAVFASAMARNDTSKAEVYASYPLVQVLQDASLPDRPSSPRKMVALAAGIAATMMILMALALSWLRQPLIDRILAR